MTATRRLLVVWAMLDGAVWQGGFLLTATGGSAITKDAGIGETRRHRRLRPSKRPCGTLDKKEVQGARGQREHW